MARKRKREREGGGKKDRSKLKLYKISGCKYSLIIDERVFKFDVRSAAITARDRNACFRVTLGLSRYRVIRGVAVRSTNNVGDLSPGRISRAFQGFDKMIYKV